MSFTLRLTIALLIALFAAALLAPWISAALDALGLRFPFPRIFDRVVMVALAVVMLANARALELVPRLAAGFANLTANVGRIVRGFAIAVAAVFAIWIAARLISGSGAVSSKLLTHLPATLAAAILIAIIEEAFFRAILLDGMRDDFGPRAALIGSGVIYALAHLVRSPARFQLHGVHPLAGFEEIASSFGQFGDPAAAVALLLGLFLLGLVLGEAFLLTGTVYFSLGMHAGLVVGAKSWRYLAPTANSAPIWLVGRARVPLIGGAGAWIIALILLLLIKPLVGANATRISSESLSKS
ncbi:MAG TPA: CPBP family glutamic-type intramembrane protease [Candidatus Binataceae bacterium]|nr:CPBP family glutamic-type intramembrane protease [Candidatus Binataceae bacterium]